MLYTMEAPTKNTGVRETGYAGDGVPAVGNLGEMKVQRSTGGTPKVQGSDSRVVETPRTVRDRKVKTPGITEKEAWKCHKEFEDVTNSDEGEDKLKLESNDWLKRMFRSFEACESDLKEQRAKINKDAKDNDILKSFNEFLITTEGVVNKNINKVNDEGIFSGIDLLQIWQLLKIQKKEINDFLIESEKYVVEAPSAVGEREIEETKMSKEEAWGHYREVVLRKEDRETLFTSISTDLNKQKTLLIAFEVCWADLIEQRKDLDDFINSQPNESEIKKGLESTESILNNAIKAARESIDLSIIMWIMPNLIVYLQDIRRHQSARIAVKVERATIPFCNALEFEDCPDFDEETRFGLYKNLYTQFERNWNDYVNWFTNKQGKGEATEADGVKAEKLKTDFETILASFDPKNLPNRKTTNKTLFGMKELLVEFQGDINNAMKG